MSSHREAPSISKDPVADNTDTYAFVSPDNPDTVTIITNYLPLEPPFGGPNFYEFGDDVHYHIHVDNDGDGYPDITYTFEFETTVRNPNTFLYNTGQIGSIDSPNWNRQQSYTVKRTGHRRGHWRPEENWSKEVIASGLACPPCNIGPASTPDYESLAQQAIHSVGGRAFFAGQRLEGFYVDLGAIFDHADLRPFEKLHIYGMANSVGVNAANGYGVHSIAIQVPKSDLTRSGRTPTDPTSSDSVIGVWGAASRQAAVIREWGGTTSAFGNWVQVSRLGNPLINEVVIPMGYKDLWNSLMPADDAQFLGNYQHPELAGLLPVLYPGVFPNLAGLTAARADLVAILLTGIPAAVGIGFQNYTGSTYADELRLNLAVPPTTSNPNPLGLVYGDAAGFPNGRRVFDDVVTIELRAIAGRTYPLVDSGYTFDPAADAIDDGLTAEMNGTYLPTFPYLGTPQSGYQTSPLALV
jgi:uncharacterized protein DUF4331